MKGVSVVMLKVISLFSGIGAHERALDELGIDFDLLHYCEWDKVKSKAYSLLYHETEDKNWGDITAVESEDVPKADLVVYSPPCQAFSIAGCRAGVHDAKSRGTLFWDALRIIKASNTKVAVMENVSNLVTDNKFKDTFAGMLSDLEDAGYNNYTQILQASDWLPQNRKRVFIVSIRKELDNGQFVFPIHSDMTEWFEYIDPMDTRECTNRQKRMMDDLIAGKELPIKIEGTPNIDTACIALLRQSGLRFYNNREVPTLCAAMGQGGGNFPILCYQGHYGGLKPRGAFKLMGFKESDCDLLEQNGFSNMALYKMAGDSVVVPCVKAVYENLRSIGLLTDTVV